MSGSARRIVVPRGVLAGVGAGGEVELGEEAWRYATRVLRLEAGASVVLLDGTGQVAAARLTSSGAVLTGEVEAAEAGESGLEVEVWCAIPKGDRWEWAVQKLCEAGARRLVPLETSRSEVRVPAGKVSGRLERWQRIADEAARQCHRSRALEVLGPRELGAALAESGPPGPGEVRLVGWAGGGEVASRGLGEVVVSGVSRVVVAVGPEGGLTAGEVGRLVGEGGFSAVRLGPRVLRVETAAVALALSAQLLAGDLG